MDGPDTPQQFCSSGSSSLLRLRAPSTGRKYIVGKQGLAWSRRRRPSSCLPLSLLRMLATDRAVLLLEVRMYFSIHITTLSHIYSVYTLYYLYCCAVRGYQLRSVEGTTDVIPTLFAVCLLATGHSVPAMYRTDYSKYDTRTNLGIFCLLSRLLPLLKAKQHTCVRLITHHRPPTNPHTHTHTTQPSIYPRALVNCCARGSRRQQQ